MVDFVLCDDVISSLYVTCRDKPETPLPPVPLVEEVLDTTTEDILPPEQLPVVIPEPEPSPVVVPEPSPVREPSPEPEPVKLVELEPLKEAENKQKSRPVSGKNAIYYKDGQDTSSCLVANSARRVRTCVAYLCSV